MEVDWTCKLESLLEEIIVNREHAARRHEVGGGSETKMATLAWDAVKRDLGEVDEGLAASIRLAYIEIWRFNIFVDWDSVKNPLPKGGLRDCIPDMALRAKVALAIAERKLSTYLLA
jgi:hypothetical protein